MKKLSLALIVVVAIFFGQIFLAGVFSQSSKTVEPVQETAKSVEMEDSRSIELDTIDRINQDRLDLPGLAENECLRDQARKKAEQIVTSKTTEEQEHVFNYQNYILECFDKTVLAVSGRTITTTNVRSSSGLFTFIKGNNEKILLNKDFSDVGVGCYADETTKLNTCLVFLYGKVNHAL